MEPFVLIVWLWMGPRFEETRIENLTRPECVEQAIAIEADRWEKRIQCIDGRGRVVFPGDPLPVRDWPLRQPGRMRV